MTRNLRTQVVDLAEHALRSWFGDDISREDAALALPGWRFVGGLDDELRAEVLSRFPASEPPAVAGRDFLAVEQDAKTIVAETVGGWDDDSRRCARCGTAYSPSYATHCVPCDGPMPVVSGVETVTVHHALARTARPNGMSYYTVCTCGWQSISFDLEEDAENAIWRHIGRAVTA